CGVAHRETHAHVGARASWRSRAGDVRRTIPVLRGSSPSPRIAPRAGRPVPAGSTPTPIAFRRPPMPVFEKRTRIAAPAELVVACHDRPEALTLLIPPGEPARVVEKTPGLQVGVRAVIEVRVGGTAHRIVAEHTACEPGRMFRDEMRAGPFKKWVHTHSME